MKLLDLYSALLGLYPYDYRVRFAGEMQEAFAEALEDRRKQRKRSIPLFVAAELTVLAFGAAREWSAKLTSDSSRRGRTLPDIRKMRPANITREEWFAAAGVADQSHTSSPSLRDTEMRTNFFLQQMVDAIARRDFEVARAWSYQEMTERRKLSILRGESSQG